MSFVRDVELFVLKCGALNSAVQKTLLPYERAGPDRNEEVILRDYIRQFDLQNRMNADNMASYYRLFYLIENDIRQLITDTLELIHGANWWHDRVPAPVKEEVYKNRKREDEAGITSRSERDIDYTTFGQLGEIVRANWTDFAGIMRNQPALNRVLHSLNMSRGTIAHCGVLAEDEVDRLKLNVRDWFRVLAGPAK